MLYEAEARGLEPAAVAAAQVVKPDELTRILVDGVTVRRVELDALISRHARGWSIERMPSLDRCVLRMAIFELLERPEVPTAVILDEAVELAKVYSTDDSGRFVNGVLSAVARQVRPVSPQPVPDQPPEALPGD
jgi:transcription antitermination protein NusB